MKESGAFGFKFDVDPKTIKVEDNGETTVKTTWEFTVSGVLNDSADLWSECIKQTQTVTVSSNTTTIDIPVEFATGTSLHSSMAPRLMMNAVTGLARRMYFEQPTQKEVDSEARIIFA